MQLVVTPEEKKRPKSRLKSWSFIKSEIAILESSDSRRGVFLVCLRSPPEMQHKTATEIIAISDIKKKKVF